MTASVIAHATAGSVNTNNVTSPAIDTTGAGIIIINVASYGSAAAPALVDSKGNVLPSLNRVFSTNQSAQGYYLIGGTLGSGHTFTATQTGSYPSIQIAAFAVPGTPTFNQQTGNFVNGGVTCIPGSITPPSNALFVSGLMFQPAMTVSTSATVLFITDQINYNVGLSFGGALGWKEQASASNPNWTGTATYGAAAAWQASFLIPAAGVAAYVPGISIEPV